MTIAVASSPVSLGVTRASEGTIPALLAGERFLEEVRRAGFAGVELGAGEYLGIGGELVERLQARDLGVSGAALELAFTSPDAMEGVTVKLDSVLDVLDMLRDEVPGPVPRLTLVDAGDERRRASPGVAHMRRDGWSLDEGGWDRFARRLDAVALHCRRRDFYAVLRPRVGTYVESPGEIDAVLRVSDIGLAFDTGQVLLGGGDPVALLRQWSDRVELVYLKDASMSRMYDIIDSGGPASTVWSREVFCPLGEGDVDCVGSLQQLAVMGYSGWLVVEQDAFASTPERIAQGLDDQRRNRRFVADQGL